MFIRALFAFLALPGVVAGLVPVLIASGDTQRHGGSAIGFGVLALGVVLLLWCVRDFYVSGKGTLAPWDPPKRLVVVGLYRFVRNPMYVAVLTVVLGWMLVFGSTWLAIYLVALAIGFHLRVLFYEEPRLRQQFAAEWSAYSAVVPRWLPRVRAENNKTRT
jgi:protein-S-isoprenylcysteine O-methyltransferase Ste14